MAEVDCFHAHSILQDTSSKEIELLYGQIVIILVKLRIENPAPTVLLH